LFSLVSYLLFCATLSAGGYFAYLDRDNFTAHIFFSTRSRILDQQDKMGKVIFGLDLSQMQWGKFKSSYMFGNTDYHLRRTKFVVYQLAMILCVVSESLGTAALSGKSSSSTHKLVQHR